MNYNSLIQRRSSIFQASFNKTKITPHFSCELFGYGYYLNRMHVGVLDDIWVRSLLLNNGEKTLLFMSYDLLLLPMSLIKSLKETIANELNISTDHIFIGCSHTHSAPTTESMFGIGEVNPDFIRFLEAQTIACIKNLNQTIQEVQLYDHEEIIESIAYNRRLNNFDSVDNRLRALIIKFKTSNVFLYNLACHTVVLGREKLISADWVGAVNKSLSEHGDEGIFFQGCSGNLDPMTNLNRKGLGKREDLEIIGSLVASRL
ncbi:hypothetical protein N9N67_12390, partial [Bacteriovoracaceae bacterium]|nr:hypothetical protein [Bacteriovoracaceae bacterium]